MTLRELQWMVVPVGIWVIASVLTSVSGPFGTHEAMTFGPRAIYWTCVCAASVGLSRVASLSQEGKSLQIRLAIWTCFAASLAAGIHIANMLLFDTWRGWGEFFYLLSIVIVVVLMVFATIWLVERDARPERVDPCLMQKFLQRVPKDKRAPLVRLEAQDHYLKVVTQVGECLILMRIGDAVAELENGHGLKTHRSHWVAFGAVKQHKRQGGRDLLMTSDDAEIPVSRSNRKHISTLLQPMREKPEVKLPI